MLSGGTKASDSIPRTSEAYVQVAATVSGCIRGNTSGARGSYRRATGNLGAAAAAMSQRTIGNLGNYLHGESVAPYHLFHHTAQH